MNHKGHCTYGLIPQSSLLAHVAVPCPCCLSWMMMCHMIVPLSSRDLKASPFSQDIREKKTEWRVTCGSLYGPESATHHFFMHPMSCNSATGQTPLQDQQENNLYLLSRMARWAAGPLSDSPCFHSACFHSAWKGRHAAARPHFSESV